MEKLINLILSHLKGKFPTKTGQTFKALGNQVCNRKELIITQGKPNPSRNPKSLNLIEVDSAIETKTITTPSPTAKRATEIKDHRKVHQRSRRTEKLTPTNSAKNNYSQPIPEERKIFLNCLQRKQDQTTTTSANDISAKQSTDDHHRHQLQNVPHSESTTHVLSACSRIAQTLYTARHNRMLRPIYCLLVFTARVLKNEKAKIYWNVPFSLRSHRKMELILSLTLLYMIKKPTSGLYLKAQSAK